MKKFGKEDVLQLTSGWNEAYAARGAAGVLGALLAGLALLALVKKKGSRIAALARLVVGVFLLAFAAWPQAIVDFYTGIPHEYRVRLLVGGLSLLVILITLESIRRTHLQERYALLWLATGGIILVSVFSPQIFVLFRTVAGMRYNQALIAVAFTFLVLVAFHFSISISSYRSNQAKIAQKVALLEERLGRLEGEVAAEDGEPGEAMGRNGDVTGTG